MQTIKTQELRERRERHEDFSLINVLNPDAFEHRHIPGSINIPVGSDDFVEQVQRAVDSDDQDVIVYCASADCDASSKAARKLEQAGFDHVHDYEAGTKGWQAAGLTIASTT